MRETIMAIDPGLRATGVAILGGKGELRHASVIATRVTDQVAKRLGHIRNAVDELMRFYRPGMLVLEATWPSSSPATSLTHNVALACRRLARAQRIPTARVAATTVRRVVLGDGWAGKWRVASHAVSVFPELRVYLHRDRAWKDRYFQNLFDAVGVALFARKDPEGLDWSFNSIRTPRHRDR